MVKELEKGVENLRSGISKVSLICICELVQQYKGVIDSEMEGVMNRVIKKSIDSSVFIIEQVETTLY